MCGQCSRVGTAAFDLLLDVDRLAQLQSELRDASVAASASGSGSGTAVRVADDRRAIEALLYGQDDVYDGPQDAVGAERARCAIRDMTIDVPSVDLIAAQAAAAAESGEACFCQPDDDYDPF
jgi:hypothetical protein